ncbi:MULTISPECIES: response regulator [Agromyces]|uniref:LuxR family transcriptional regulator n=1 Tax=Agromyces aureus TaxID=453304 RepID=A0A191WF50_9MICO|nr:MULTISPECIES: response regulator transcription factor [Agromyces]ANJ26852.1 LuxR family transcriptional regulator [Agromyces aureus]KQM83275.1 LuxR family transcriptional regulator [Agromyces sp. Leaf222]
MSTAGRPIRVAIADDQALVRTGLRMVLEAEPDLVVVGEANDGGSAIDLVAALDVDVMLMDVRMPGVDGIAATEAIVAGGRPTRVLVLTTFDLDEYAFAAIRAGASGFLLKDSRPVELAGAIRTVHAGEAALAPRVTRRMIELFGAELPRPAAAEAPGLSSLTAREHEILIAIAEGRSNTEIAADFVLSESTVKTHVGRVLLKLDARDRVQLVIYAYEHGLLPRAGSA